MYTHICCTIHALLLKTIRIHMHKQAYAKQVYTRINRHIPISWSCVHMQAPICTNRYALTHIYNHTPISCSGIHTQTHFIRKQAHDNLKTFFIKNYKIFVISIQTSTNFRLLFINFTKNLHTFYQKVTQNLYKIYFTVILHAKKRK